MDKLQGKVAQGLARKKTSAPAYAPVNPTGGKRPTQTPKEPAADKTEKTGVATTGAPQPPTAPSTKVLTTHNDVHLYTHHLFPLSHFRRQRCPLCMLPPCPQPTEPRTRGARC